MYQWWKNFINQYQKFIDGTNSTTYFIIFINLNELESKIENICEDSDLLFLSVDN